MSDDASRHEPNSRNRPAGAWRRSAPARQPRSGRLSWTRTAPPTAEIAELERSGRQHEYTDTAAYNQQQPAAVDRRRRGGPRR